MPLIGGPICIYCGALGNTSDHIPPRCLLPPTLPNDLQAMTVPACEDCNSSYSADDMRVAAVVAIVSCMPQDREAVADGGRIHRRLRADHALREFIDNRLGADGIFLADAEVRRTISRIMARTTAGLLFHEFGRVVCTSSVHVIAIEHTSNVHPLVLIENYRSANGCWAEITPSGHALERHAQAACGEVPTNMPKWRVYVPDYFEYMFIRRSDNMLLTAINLHNALTIIAESPWPSSAGPRRRGSRLRASRR